MPLPDRSQHLRPILRIPPLLRVFTLPTLRHTSLVAAGVLLVSLVAGAVRAMPLLLGPGVPARLALPFARAALFVSLEAALFVAPPIAAALVAARIVDRGEARAVFALGMSPRALVLGAWPVWLLVALAAACASAAWGREAQAPGRIVVELLHEGRAACAAEARRRPHAPVAVEVPLASVSWVCLPGEAPRAVGVLPAGQRAAFAARSIEPSADLASLHLYDLSIAVPAGEAHGPAYARVGDASIRGLVPLGRPSNLRAPLRAALLGLTAAVGAALAAFVVITWSIGGRAIALGIGLAGPSAALMVLSSLERAPSPIAAYAGVFAAAVAAPLAGAFLAGRARAWRGFSG